MTLLYRVGDDIVIEMSRESWRIVERVVRDALLAELFPASTQGYGAAEFSEIEGFASAIRSHLQHLEAVKPVIPDEPGCSAAQTNLDLI